MNNLFIYTIYIFLFIKVDIWSVGVILFTLCCGYLPFEDQNTSHLYKKILAGNYSTPKWLSSNVKDLLRKILEVKPTKRYTINDIRSHKWYTTVNENEIPCEDILVTNNPELEIKVMDEMMTQGYNRVEVLEGVTNNNYNPVTASYYLMKQKYYHMTPKKGNINTASNTNNNNNNTSNNNATSTQPVSNQISQNTVNVPATNESIEIPKSNQESTIVVSNYDLNKDKDDVENDEANNGVSSVSSLKVESEKLHSSISLAYDDTDHALVNNPSTLNDPLTSLDPTGAVTTQNTTQIQTTEVDSENNQTNASDIHIITTALQNTALTSGHNTNDHSKVISNNNTTNIVSGSNSEVNNNNAVSNSVNTQINLKPSPPVTYKRTSNPTVVKSNDLRLASSVDSQDKNTLKIIKNTTMAAVSNFPRININKSNELKPQIINGQRNLISPRIKNTNPTHISTSTNNTTIIAKTSSRSTSNESHTGNDGVSVSNRKKLTDNIPEIFKPVPYPTLPTNTIQTSNPRVLNLILKPQQPIPIQSAPIASKSSAVNSGQNSQRKGRILKPILADGTNPLDKINSKISSRLTQDFDGVSIS